jgi:cyclopropane fatty-acyl-phospholipid synthase-like methyltransferase
MTVMPSSLSIPSSLGGAGPVPVAGQYLPATSDKASVRRYYRRKIAAIVDRYGPGPRVHYHIGLFDDHRLAPGATAEQIRARIVAAQERMLERAASVWDAGTMFTGNLLDVGCGLGGGAIYWAQHFPVQVTALTNVAEQAAATRAFAVAAGVGERVRPLVTDVCDLRSTRKYMAAVAVESSCYVPRPQLFKRIAAALAPGGVFGIEDIFLTRPAWRELFDAYWKTLIGTVSQYQQAAEQADLVLDRNLDVTAHTSEFWRQSVAWARARLAESAADPLETERLVRSIRWHSRFLQGWRDGAYQARILRFRKPG